MADAAVHIGENSPEYVAYRLMRDIVSGEGRSLNANTGNPISREYLLQTYAQCLSVVRGWNGTSAIKEIPTVA